jgi:hypothetical protein
MKPYTSFLQITITFVRLLGLIVILPSNLDRAISALPTVVVLVDLKRSTATQVPSFSPKTK